MRGGMTEYEERIGIFFGEYLQLYVLVERTAQIDQFAGAIIGRGDTGNERGVGEARRNSSGDVGGSGALRHFLDFAVRQCDVNRLHTLST